MAMLSSVRFGFIGAGQIAEYAVAAVRSHSEASLLAVQDINPERLSAFCRSHAIPASCAEAGELLANPEIDAVYIAVPNKFHAPLAIAAMEAGKHVLLEKPFAMNYAEALAVADVARRTGRVLTLGMNVRFNREVQRIRGLVAANALGEIYHAKAYWMRRTGIPRLGTWFGNRDLAGGGCLSDIGVHMLDVCLYVTGNFEPVSVFGATYGKFGHRGLGEGSWGRSERSAITFDVEDFASGFIRFANGATMALDVSWACHQPEPNRFGVELFGTEGGANAITGRYFAPARGDSPGSGYQVIQDVSAPSDFPHNERFHNFINHLLGHEELCVTVEQALTVQRVLDALAASAACGREVRLDN